MLRRVHPFVRQSGLEQHGSVPHPQSDGVNPPGAERAGDGMPDLLNGGRLRPMADTSPPGGWYSPKKRQQRARKREERRGGEHQDFVLRHVRAEQYFTQGVERRDQGQSENGEPRSEEHTSELQS